MADYSEIIKGRHVILTENGMYEPTYNMRYKGRIDEQLDTFINQRPIKIMDVACMEGAHNISLSQYSGGDGGAPSGGGGGGSGGLPPHMINILLK